MKVNIFPQISNTLDHNRLKKLAKLILEGEGALAKTSVNIILTDNSYIKRLNQKFRGIHSPTDVLAFPASGFTPPKSPPFIGEVYISLERAQIQAQDYGVSFQEEVERLLAHGILHLLGYSHEKQKTQEEMDKKTEYYLQKIGKEDK